RMPNQITKFSFRKLDFGAAGVFSSGVPTLRIGCGVESLNSGLIVALLIAGLIFVVALLYSTVGHAGASGYLAAMALFGMAPLVMKPTALLLNILVASIGAIRFYRAGFFSWRTFWPFAIASIPASYIGGSLALPDFLYKI